MYAPIIIASPCFSKKPPRSNAIPKAQIEKSYECLKILRNFAIFLENKRPAAVNTSHIPKARAAIKRILTPSIETCPPSEFKAATIPITTARRIIPRTSSKTAEARIVTPSGESIFFLSDKMRAVIPTEVAVDIIPRKRHLTSIIPQPKSIIPAMSPKRNEATTPPRPITPPARE